MGGALFNLLQKVCLRCPGSLDILVKAHQRNRTNSMYIEIHKKTSLVAQKVKCLPTWGRKESDTTERLHTHSEIRKRRFLIGIGFDYGNPRSLLSANRRNRKASVERPENEGAAGISPQV